MNAVEESINNIEEIRKKNNVLWMDVIRLAFEVAPDRAKAIMAKIIANDRMVSDQCEKIVREGEYVD